MKNSKYLEELNFCITLWEKEEGCTFGGKTECKKCAAPYLLLKLATGEVLHGKMKRFTLKDWKEKISKIKKD